MLDKIVAEVSDRKQIQIDLDDQGRDRLLQAALGLTLGEAENVFAKIIVQEQRLSGDYVNEVFAEKQQIIRKSGLLEYYKTEDDFASVGGLTVLKDWLNKRSIAFTDEARAFGLPAPKGILLLGVQGCGKSLCAKAVFAAVATAAAAVRHGPDVRQPGGFRRKKTSGGRLPWRNPWRRRCCGWTRLTRRSSARKALARPMVARPRASSARFSPGSRKKTRRCSW